MGSAELEGAFWGARAQDWADIQQRTVRPAALAVLAELGPWPGRTLLDIGCGAGDFASLASNRGAVVLGLDASAALIDIARRQAPTGRFLVSDMEHIPFADNAFTTVTTFNSLHLASDPTLALQEAIRVTRPGGSFVAVTWGPPSECDAATYLIEIGGLLPPDTPTPLDPSDPDALKGLLTRAGLVPSPWRVVPCPWEYADLETALCGLLSTGPAMRAINHSGQIQVIETIAESISPYRRGDGTYRLDNTCYYVVATVDRK
ncbi:MAG TPA: class I SAM-dependent methyltransferase [Actinophytocola sp.]|jgi:SAM-dependent methyltransferase|uniref:class I SAM-dependent methyltransferase n=1 Tax=Actinophytocola sp. TaxID=1872138 RepID=UPI002DF96C05|nr:class I SAM-dependent methyltransferase [Actinophytocola sp.]